jgi:type VI secretion system protein ImpM
MLGAALDAGNPAASPGYFGKLPGFADFVTRRLPRSFVDPWDDWLQQCILSARDRLGVGWLDTYLTSPIWRFAVGAGVCGTAGWTGLLMPSVDRVGRHFPLTLATELPTESGLLSVLAEDAWFDRLEQLALTTLDEPFDLAVFDQELQALALQASGNPLLSKLRGTEGVSWCFELPSIAFLGQSLPAILESLFRGQLDRHTFWWTSGSAKVKPCLLTCRGLPHTASSAAFLDGNWSRWGWAGQL